MALGGTYDAVEPARLNMRGMQPNAKEARRWKRRTLTSGCGVGAGSVPGVRVG
jgi:hypothetical protein